MQEIYAVCKAAPPKQSLAPPPSLSALKETHLPLLRKRFEDLYTAFYEDWIARIKKQSLDELLDSSRPVRDPIHNPHLLIPNLERRKAFKTQETILGGYTESMAEAVLSVRAGHAIKTEKGALDFDTEETTGKSGNQAASFLDLVENGVRILWSLKTSANHANSTEWTGFHLLLKEIVKKVQDNRKGAVQKTAVIVASVAGSSISAPSKIEGTKVPLYKVGGQAAWTLLTGGDTDFYLRIEEWKRPIADIYEPQVEQAILEASARHEKELRDRFEVNGVLDVTAIVRHVCSNLHQARGAKAEVFKLLGLTRVLPSRNSHFEQGSKANGSG